MSTRRRSRLLQPNVRWLGRQKVESKEVNPFTKQSTTYEGVEFGNITAYVHDYVMVSNADADEPDTLDGCDVARIDHLFESTSKGDKYRANVQWYSKSSQMPRGLECDHLDTQYEVVEEHRKYDSNVSIETFFKKCNVVMAYEDESPEELYLKNKSSNAPVFICRYRLLQKRNKYFLEPVLKLDTIVLSSITPIKNEPSSGNVKENKDLMKNMTDTPNTPRRNKKHTGNESQCTPLQSKVIKGILHSPKLNSAIFDLGIEPVVVLRDIKPKSVLRKMSVDSDSDRSKGTTLRNVSRGNTRSSNEISVMCSNVKSKENLDSDSENSQKSVSRKSTKNKTPLKSNIVNMLKNTNYYSDIENSPSNKVANGKNEVIKCTPHKTGSYADNRKRKASRSRSTSESSLEPRSRSISPEILCTGPPATYKLYEKSGQSLVIKKPLNIETKAPKKLNDLDISGMLDSDNDSDCEALIDKAIKNGAKIVAQSKPDQDDELELLSSPKNNLRTPKSNCTAKKSQNTVPKSARRNLSSTLDVESNNPKNLLLRKLEQQREDVSLRIKLRRSTEQSNYKIDSDSDCDVSKRKTIHRTPKSILKMNSKVSGSPSVRFKLNGKEESLNAEEQVTGIPSSEQSENGSVRKSRRTRTPNSRFSDNYITMDSNTNRDVPRRTRRSINYKEDDLYESLSPRNKTKTRQSATGVNYIGNMDSDASIGSPIKKSKSENVEQNSKLNPRRRDEPRKDSKTMEDDDQVDVKSFFETIITKPRSRVSTVNAQGDVPKTPRRSSRVNHDDDLSSDASDVKGPPKSTKNDRHYKNNNLETSRTPRRSKKFVGGDDISTPSRKNSMVHDESLEPTTPKRSVGTPKSQTPAMAIKKGLLKPSMLKRNGSIARPATDLQEARARLHVSAVPKSLPCREEEFNNIYIFLEGKLLDNSGGCMYISGVPGTGKTATVNEVIRCLRKTVDKGNINNFDFVEINGMKLTEPRQAYVHILKQLTGRTATWEQAHQILDKRFTRPAPRRLMTLLLVDELDVLCNKRQDVVYNLLDWPTKTSAQLVVITIANTMDMPERVLMGRVTSRLGLTRLTFQPYNHKQLQEIVTARLKDSEAFKSEAVQLVARKVAAVSGDARRALDICRRATEIAELSTSKIVSMQDVDQALTEMIASAKVQAIRHCSEMEQTFLQAVCAEVSRTGVEEVGFNNVYIQLRTLCSFEGIKVPTVTEAVTICARLGASRLLICEHSRKDIHQRILLNISSDDVYFAMQNIEI